MCHPIGRGQEAFHWKGSTIRHSYNDESSESAACTGTLFTEPIQWMEKSILSVEGKVGCRCVIYIHCTALTEGDLCIDPYLKRELIYSRETTRRNRACWHSLQHYENGHDSFCGHFCTVSLFLCNP